jgi:hypothetical protein
MFETLKKLFTKEPQPQAAEPPKPPQPPKVVAAESAAEPPKKRKPRKKKEETVVTLSPKELATQRGEPYVQVMGFEMDSKDMHTGNFSIDFNDKFVLNLVRAGYKQKNTDTDNDIVDRWFTQICRNIVLEQHEQLVADPLNRENDLRIIRRKNIGDGRAEIS